MLSSCRSGHTVWGESLWLWLLNTRQPFFWKASSVTEMQSSPALIAPSQLNQDVGGCWVKTPVSRFFMQKWLTFQCSSCFSWFFRISSKESKPTFLSVSMILWIVIFTTVNIVTRYSKNWEWNVSLSPLLRKFKLKRFCRLGYISLLPLNMSYMFRYILYFPARKFSLPLCFFPPPFLFLR